MSENTLVSYVREGVKPFAEFAKHNDACTIGVPDISLFVRKYSVNLWIEAKEKEDWPAKETTKVFWDHYTEQQALWLRNRKGWLLCRIGRAYLLFDWGAAWALWNEKGWTHDAMMHRARAVWNGRIPWAEFIDIVGGSHVDK